MPVTLRFVLPDAEAPAILKELALKYGYAKTVVVDGVETPNPESRKDFVERAIAAEWIELVVRREAIDAAAVAGDAARAAARGRIVIT